MLKKKVLWLFILLIGTGSLWSQDLDQQLQQIVDDFQLMGMSVVVSSGDQTDSFHYGLRDLQRGFPVEERTRFRIASISKTFTALGLLKLHDQGLFDLDDDINDYLSFEVRNPAFPGVPITFRMLLSHQSSLQDGSGYSDFLSATYQELPIPTLGELVIPGGAYYTTDMWRTEAPGTFFAYSNLNYGLIGTLIEALSGQRFDVFMRTAVLEPLQTGASYNVRDLDDIDQVAVLYRFNGNWEPQFDHFKGVPPAPLELGNYQLGTNGLIFSPQGGLRASALEVAQILELLRSGDGSDLGLLPSTLAEMITTQWEFNGSNGDNYFGLFNRWGLGVHLANTFAYDVICGPEQADVFVGHPGEAYGLISDAYADVANGNSLVLLINGKQSPYQSGNNSAFYQVEEAVFAAVCGYWESILSSSSSSPTDQLILSPNPSNGTVRLHNRWQTPLSWRLIDSRGSLIRAGNTSNQSILDIELMGQATGLYILEVTSGSRRQLLKLLIE